MTKTVKRALSIGLCATLCMGGFGAVAHAMMGAPSAPDQMSTKSIPADVDIDEMIASMGLNTGTERNAKDETVYVIAGADGSVEKLIVSNWIKNKLASDSIIDHTAITNIRNVKGDESYAINAMNMKVWDAKGNDIYYRGDIKKELPVDLKLSYQLDGKSIAAKDLAGKSGRVTIRFDYDNKQAFDLNIEGYQQKFYVPFAMLSGTLLDNDIFRNVEVTNGKIINDGSRTAVIGLALPGLQENLGLSEDKLKIPDYFEISADVQNFELGMTATVATTEPFSQIDTTKLDSAKDLEAQLRQMNDGMAQLMDGSSKLYGGLATMLDKSGQLVAGVNALAEGAALLKSNAPTLQEGVAALRDGLAALQNGLSQLDQNSDRLNDGAKQIFETLLATADKGFKLVDPKAPALSIENYDEILGGYIAKLDPDNIYNKIHAEAVKQATACKSCIVENVTKVMRLDYRQQIFEQKRQSIYEEYKTKAAAEILAKLTKVHLGRAMTEAEYQAAIEAGEVEAETQALIDAEYQKRREDPVLLAQLQVRADVRMADKDICEEISAQVDQHFTDPAVQQEIARRVDKEIEASIAKFMSSKLIEVQLQLADAGAKKLAELKAGLDQYNQFYIGLQAYTNGVGVAAQGAAQLYDGANRLSDGTAQLVAGINALYDGAIRLKDGMPTLTDGVEQLKGGSMQLDDGLKQFNEQAVQKIVKLADGDMKRAMLGLRASVEIAKNYRSFSGMSPDMDGQVKFIYKTAGVKPAKQD